MFIASLCIFIALNCFKLEVLKRQNNLSMERNVLKVECNQKIKEYMLTELDELLYKNVTSITDEGIRSYLNSMGDYTTENHIVEYDNSYIKYKKEKDYFVVMYYVNSEFYKKEFYKCKVENNLIFYNCIGYSFDKGAEL